MGSVSACRIGAYVGAAKVRPRGAMPSCGAAVGGISDRRAVRVARDLGYRELVRRLAARGTSLVCRASGKEEPILDLHPSAEPEKGFRVRRNS